MQWAVSLVIWTQYVISFSQQATEVWLLIPIYRISSKAKKGRLPSKFTLLVRMSRQISLPLKLLLKKQPIISGDQQIKEKTKKSFR